MLRRKELRLLWVLLGLVCCYSFSEEVKLTSPDYTTVYDDSYAEVPLQFVFPFYDKEFETSYMYTNGILGFRDPTGINVENHWCCDGQDLEARAKSGEDISRYGYIIAPLWTDLIDLELENSGLFTQGDTTQQTYMWRNLAEYYDATKLNTFEVQIRQDGTYTIDYTAVNITSHAVSTGIAGSLEVNNYNGVQESYYPNGFTGVPSGFGNLNLTLCVANELYDPQCPNYATAYAQELYSQACASDSLYDTGCTGYSAAYYDQQCMYNPQYDELCAGYLAQEPEQEAVLIEEVLEQPDLTTDFTSASGYEIEGIPSFTMPTFEIPQVIEIPPVVEQEQVVEVVSEMQQLEQDLETEIALIEPEPNELEQSEVPEREVGEEPSEEAGESEPSTEPEEEQEQQKEVVVEKSNSSDKKQQVETATSEQQATTPEVTEKQALTKNEKLKALVVEKAVSLTKQVDEAVTLEQQIMVQQQLLALISFVPDFNYAEGKVKDLETFYPPQQNIDSSFSRWFRTDPNFEILEDSQYPQRNTRWQR
jgi:hypothetical protein